MYSSVKLIDDEDAQSCIQKYQKIKREYQNTGPAGKKNEPVLWKKLNAAADRFYEADKALMNDELNIISDLTSQLQNDDCSIQDIKEKIGELNKTRKSSEFAKLQKAIKSYENKKIDELNAEKINIYQNLLNLLNTSDEDNAIIHKEIFKALKRRFSFVIFI